MEFNPNIVIYIRECHLVPTFDAFFKLVVDVIFHLDRTHSSSASVAIKKKFLFSHRWFLLNMLV